MSEPAPNLPQFAVGCPKCGAPQGKRCINPAYGHRIFTHSQRIKLALQLAPFLAADIKETE